MKISQYILLSFLGFVLAAVLVLFIDSLDKEHLHPSYNFVDLGKVISKNNLDDFSVIVAEQEANILIKNDSVNTIGATLHLKDSMFNLPEYKIINDTLYISKSKYEAKTNIYCKDVKTVIAQKKSHIHFKDYKTDSLTIYANNSVVKGWLVNTSMKQINVEAINNTNMSVIIAQPIDNCELKIDSSFVRLHGKGNKISNLKATLKNKTKIEMKTVETSRINCDSTSSYQIHNYIE